MSVRVEAVIAAFVPALIWLAIVYSRDRYEREPKRLIELLFLGSFLSVGMAFVLEKSLQLNIASRSVAIVVASAVAVGLIEEGSKFSVAYLLTRKNPHLNEPVDGMIYASSVALGFAAIETTAYILRFYHKAMAAIIAHGYNALVAQHVASQVAFHQVAPGRAFLGCLGHLSFTGIIGYAYGMQRTHGARRGEILRAYLLAAMLHAAYDAFLGLGASTLALATLGFSVSLYIARFRHALSLSPFRTDQIRMATPPATPPA